MILKNIFVFLRPFLLQDKKNLLLYFICGTIAWAIGLTLPYLTGLYIDRLVGGVGVPVIFNFLMVIAILNIINLMNDGVHTVVGTIFNNKLAYNLSATTINNLHKSKLSKLIGKDKNELLNQILEDCRTLIIIFSNTSIHVILQLATFIVSTIILIQADVLLSIVIFSVIPLYIIFYFIFKKKLSKVTREDKINADQYFATRAEQINKIEFIKRNNTISEMKDRLFSSFSVMNHYNLKSVVVGFLFSSTGKFASALCQIIVFGLGGYRVFTGYMSIGTFTIITVYFAMMIASVDYYLNLAQGFHYGKFAIERLSEKLESDLEINGATTLNNLSKIQINKLSVQYDPEHDTIFKNLNISFEKGKIYAVCGKNGAGKTTLLNCIIGLYSDLINGTITYDNLNINELNMAGLRRDKISYVEQFPEFFNLSISEYLQLGIAGNLSVIEKQNYLYKIFGLNKFDTDLNISSSGNNFSGGEKQKLALTRALSKDSFLAILDEPTSALDHASVDTLVQILNEQKPNRITLVVSHDQRILDLCDEHINI